jgi:hypothetical protein
MVPEDHRSKCLRALVSGLTSPSRDLSLERPEVVRK